MASNTSLSVSDAALSPITVEALELPPIVKDKATDQDVEAPQIADAFQPNDHFFMTMAADMTRMLNQTYSHISDLSTAVFCSCLCIWVPS